MRVVGFIDTQEQWNQFKEKNRLKFLFDMDDETQNILNEMKVLNIDRIGVSDAYIMDVTYFEHNYILEVDMFTRGINFLGHNILFEQKVSKASKTIIQFMIESTEETFDDSDG